LADEIASQLRTDAGEMARPVILDAFPPAFSRRAMRRKLSPRQRMPRQAERGGAGSLRHAGVVVNRELMAAIVRLHLRRSRLGDDFDWRGAVDRHLTLRLTGPDVPVDLFVTADGVANSGSRSFRLGGGPQGPLYVHDVQGGASRWSLSRMCRSLPRC
jgi:hypothetical protein